MIEESSGFEEAPRKAAAYQLFTRYFRKMKKRMEKEHIYSHGRAAVVSNVYSSLPSTNRKI